MLEGTSTYLWSAKKKIAYLWTALLHGPEQIADLPVPVAESPGAVRIGHPERSHLVEYLATQFGVQLVASPTFEPASPAR